MIVDDDRAHGESLSDLLNAKGHEAYFAANLSEAKWLLGLFRFHLAILDYDMPGLTGPQVARKLQENCPELRAAVMSARKVSRQRRVELGAFPFLPKPICVEELMALISASTSREATKSIMVRVSFPLQRHPQKNPRRTPRKSPE